MKYSKTIQRDIIAHAAAEYPRESCGLVVGREYVPCENISKDPDQFEISAEDFVRCSEKGKIRAVVHSHPDGTTKPSNPDRVQMNFHGIPWLITDGETVEEHTPDGYVAPLIGREYVHGLMDCYSIVRDYYARELNIELGDYDRADRWWESADAASLYLDNFKKEGFQEVEGPPQKHDLFLCKIGRTEHVNHAAIFVAGGDLTSEHAPPTIGDSLILHHPFGRPSVREVYGDMWRRRTAVVIRHKTLL